MTETEKVLWRVLRTNHLGGRHFRRQQVIDGFIADFYCHDARLVLEVDGDIHRNQAEYDIERDETLKARGLRVLCVTNEEVRNDLPGVLDRIADAIAQTNLTLNPFPTREGTRDTPSLGRGRVRYATA